MFLLSRGNSDFMQTKLELDSKLAYKLAMI